MSIRVHSCLFVSIRGFESSLSFVLFVVHLNIRVHSCPFVSIRGSESFSCISCRSWFRVFSCLSWFTSTFVSIRVHSCPFVVLSLFRVFRVFRGSPQYSCPFVPFRGSESFRVFRVFRGSPQYSCPFVSIRSSESFRVFRVFRGSEPKAPAKRTLKDSRLLTTWIPANA